MATTQEFLAAKGVSMQQALDFVLGNLSSPDTIFQVAKQNGVTASMLADIVRPAVPEASATLVKGFFANYGFNTDQLESTISAQPTPPAGDFTIELKSAYGSASLNYSQAEFLVALEIAASTSSIYDEHLISEGLQDGGYIVHTILNNVDVPDIKFDMTATQYVNSEAVLLQASDSIQGVVDNISAKYKTVLDYIDSLPEGDNGPLPDGMMEQYLAFSNELHSTISNIALVGYNQIINHTSTDWVVV